MLYPKYTSVHEHCHGISLDVWEPTYIVVMLGSYLSEETFLCEEMVEQDEKMNSGGDTAPQPPRVSWSH